MSISDDKERRKRAYEKKVRHAQNRNILTGRDHGSTFIGGRIRAGGYNTEVVEKTYHEAILEEPDHVIRVLGICERGESIPFEERRPAVRPVRVSVKKSIWR